MRALSARRVPCEKCRQIAGRPPALDRICRRRSSKNDVQRHRLPKSDIRRLKSLRFFVGTQSAFNRDTLSRRTRTMIHSAEINRVLARAKQQRAEYIDSALKTRALPVAVVVALSLAFLTFISEPAPDPTLGRQGVQITTHQV